jgi:hypothetical protein
MPRAKKVKAVASDAVITEEDLDQAVADIEPVAEPEAEVDTIKAEVKTSFTVLNGSGDPVRTFPVDIHGERAEELAHEFAATNGYSVQS